ncbi:hypothetical protein JXL19_12945 [bacterium]|nr:hypothetical protein [bacterium]
MSKKGLLLSTNVAYWPSVGGTERVLQNILEGVSDLFERVVVFCPRENGEIVFHNGVEIFPYKRRVLRAFARKNRPAVYFPNVVHSPITYENIKKISGYSKKTIVNMVGGYGIGYPLRLRKRYLDNIERFADCAVHVDRLSIEYFIDNAINPNIHFAFINQGISFEELDSYRPVVGMNDAPYFVYAHNLWDWKRPEIFIRDIVAMLPDIDFKIVAHDKTGNVIKDVIDMSKNYPNLEVLLGLKRDEFLKAIANSSGIISTSGIEGAQPNIMLESGYLGIPYLTSAPYQNFGHYPHVEMFEDVPHLAERVKKIRYSILKEKEKELARAREFFSREVFSWVYIIEQYRSLFTEA